MFEKKIVKKSQNNKKSFCLFSSQIQLKFSKCKKRYRQKECVFSNLKTDIQNTKLKMNSTLKIKN